MCPVSLMSLDIEIYEPNQLKVDARSFLKGSTTHELKSSPQNSKYSLCLWEFVKIQFNECRL